MNRTCEGGARARLLAAFACALALAACGGGGGDSGGGSGGGNGGNNGNNGGGDGGGSVAPQPTPLPVSSALPAVDATQWHEAAVRNVLQTFAYGSQASDAQIREWAAMPPQQAIVQMLDFAPFNPRLSPGLGGADPLRTGGGTLAGLSAYWRGASSPFPQATRAAFDIGGSWGGVARVGLQAGMTPGLNPFLHRVLFWETNYHLAVNQEVDVSGAQIGAYYDTLLQSFAAGDSYSRSLARAAMSAAIGRQYGHFRNTYDNARGVFRGNEDFAREFHQLFFGILGTTQPEDAAPRATGEDSYHEVVTVKNTARLLTDMTEPSDHATELAFGTAQHHQAPLEILHAQIAGATARDKLLALAEVAIRHPESEANLPVKIVAGLANDRLGAADIAELRAYWRDMGQRKSLLDFLRAYAISRQFHDPARVKYLTPLERNMVLLNRFALTRQESELVGLYSAIGLVTWEEGFDAFSPSHNVFGHTTGEETSLAADHFRVVYNRGIDGLWRFARVDGDGNAELAAQAPGWEKRWDALAPREADGGWRTGRVAGWLWQRFIGGGGFGAHERLYTYALLGTGRDAGYYCTGNGAAGTDPDYVFTDADFAPGALGSRCLEGLAALPLALDSADATVRKDANRRVAYAVAFLSALPQAQVVRGE
ncbi:hypothetical protein GCM10007860_29740 [Chitiniphilus shinanonensis]|uniref:Lipoprotein n=1 Tax=Chitiniphilus shinanonensis TaxID=553088 RepID=A0ABQ6BZ57_9NEIS|nr:DUF1800 family protein [Chitiniphilus shinanonensis]GLS05816.1 hypothetical protein GCM10007860_29740 [Chitiniphilus shinanonensis]